MLYIFAVSIDGPLPTFPSHLRCYLKDMLGAHESSFWRDLFSQVSNQHDMVQTPLTKGSSNYNPYMPTHTREIQDFSMLVKEQQRKIELLETQLNDERLQHELQMQRSAYTHRVEMEKLKKHMQNVEEVLHHEVNTNTIVNNRNNNNNSSSYHDSFANHDANSSTVRMPTASSFDDSMMKNNNINMHNTQKTNNNLVDILSRNSVDFDYRTTGKSASSAQDEAMNASLDMDMGQGKRVPPPIPAFNFLKQQIAAAVNNIEVSDETNTNAAVAGATGMGMGMDKTSSQQSSNKNVNNSNTRYGNGNGNGSMNTTVNNNSDAKSESARSSHQEEDFLQYIEKFQKEVRSLQVASPHR